MKYSPCRKEPFYYMLHVPSVPPATDPNEYTREGLKVFGRVEYSDSQHEHLYKILYIMLVPEGKWRRFDNEDRFDTVFQPDQKAGSYTFYESINEWVAGEFVDLV